MLDPAGARLARSSSSSPRVLQTNRCGTPAARNEVPMGLFAYICLCDETIITYCVCFVKYKELVAQLGLLSAYGLILYKLYVSNVYNLPFEVINAPSR